MKKEILKVYLQYLTPYRRQILGLSILSLIAGVGVVPIPFMYSQMVDRDLPNRDINSLIFHLGILVGLIASETILTFLIRRLGVSIHQRFKINLRSSLYASVQRLPYVQFSQFMSGDLVSRLTRDFETLNQLLPKGLAFIVKDTLSVLGLVGLLLYLNWKLTLVSSVIIPFFFLVFLKVLRSLNQKAKISQKTQGNMHAMFQEKLEGNREIRITNSYEHQEKETSKIIDHSERVVSELTIQEANMGLVISIFPILGTLILWGVGGWWVIQGHMSLGSIIAFGFGFTYLFQPITGLISGFTSIQVELAALERIFQIVPPQTLEPLQQEIGTRSKFRGHVLFENVNFSYHSGAPILKQLSLNILPNTVTVLVGPSGAGKTTVLSLLLRLYEPQEGRITLDGKLLKDIPMPQLRKCIAVVPQQTFLFHGTIRDNILMGRDILESNYENACRLSGIRNTDEVVLEKGNNLSGGEKQRIAIARALAEDPSILILDEPTNNLDNESKILLKELLSQFGKDKTILLITHDENLFHGMENVSEIRDGACIRK